MDNLLSEAELTALTKSNRAAEWVKKPLGLLYLQQLLQKDESWWTAINEQMVRLFNNFMSQQHVQSDFNYVGMKLYRYGEWLATQENPSVFQVFSAPPLNHHCLFSIPSDSVFYLVESFFGGGELSVTQIRRQEFTLMELRLVNRIVPQLLEAFNTVWQAIVPVECEAYPLEFNPKQCTYFKEEDYVFIATFKSDNGLVKFDCVYPHQVMQQVHRDYMGKVKVKCHQDSDSSISRYILDLPVEVRSIISEVACNLRDVLNLVVGDSLPVNMNSKAIVKIEDEPAFAADYLDQKPGKLKIVRVLGK